MKPPRIVDIGASGSPTTILATVPCRRWIIRESLVKADGSSANTPQGFKIQAADNHGGTAYGPVEERAAASTTNEPGTFPEYSFPDVNDTSFHETHGAIVANGPGIVIGVGATAALPLCKVSSLTGTATSVSVTEIY
jgi:hypothetical protein